MEKKKGLLFLTSLLALASLTGCHKKLIEIAVVTDVGSLNDGGFNQGTYEGVKQFAEANGKNFDYYMPSGQNNATDADREAAMIQAIESGAKIIVAPGYLQAKAMAKCAAAHPNIKFVFMDGLVLKDEKGQVLKNVTAINYREEEAGFLAGYAVTKDEELLTSNPKKLGGVFGGGGSNRACNAFAYGYAQGIHQAAVDLKNENKGLPNKPQLRLSYQHGEQFSASSALETQVSGWFEDGVEIIFACGGSMAFSVKSAVDKTTAGKMIGVDVDQSSLSDRIVTSAMKNLSTSIKNTLSLCYANEWDNKLSGKIYTLGAKDDGVGLPTDEYEKDGKKINPWRFKKFTKEDYKKLFKRVRGEDEDKEKNITVASVPLDADCNKSDFWKNANEKIMNEIEIELISGQ